jgi:MurNAc alpha-1-phosphate uridylyltransferase
LRAAIDANRAGGEIHGGIWVDVGTPQRLGELDAMLVGRQPSTSTHISEPQGA